MPSPSLASLPIEIQTSIFRFLDPIALISFGQTNSHFRCLIQPTRSHFVERLLALECREKEGGPFESLFLHNNSKFDPDWDNTSKWESMRWACTSCLRLLPHTAFNNRSLLRLCYRKPIPGSTAANPCTSWEPAAKQSYNYHLHQRLKHNSTEEKRARKRYGIATTVNWGDRRDNERLEERWIEFKESGIVAFQNMSLSEFQLLTDEEEQAILDAEARTIEWEKCGFKRHLRRCNECRYQRGELKPKHQNQSWPPITGSTKVPIIIGRQQTFGTSLDRYFPGFSEVLENKRPLFNAPVFIIYREGAVDRLWTLYRIRCSGCSRWREMRDFRFGNLWPRWEPRVKIDSNDNNDHDRYYTWDDWEVTYRVINRLQCNRCFLHEHGREALSQGILAWLNHILDREIEEQGGRLVSGWNHIYHLLRVVPKSCKFRAEIRKLIWDMRYLLDRPSSELNRSDVAFLRVRRGQWLDIWARMKSEDQTHWARPDALFMGWIDMYDESEAMWTWMKGCKEEIQDKADFLVDWVLSRDAQS